MPGDLSENWFGTEYYHLLYSHRNDSEAGVFLRNLISYLNLPLNSKVLDLGCGRGRHARQLSKMGYDVTGIDIEESNIGFARKFEGKNLSFHCSDKRKIFRKNFFDMALNLFTSFGYENEGEDLSIPLFVMGENLKPGGIFVLDYFNSGLLNKNECGNQKTMRNNITFTISKQISSNYIIKQITVEDGLKSEHYSEKVRLLGLGDFRALFEKTPLKILHTFGNYHLSPFNPDTSDRLIIIAEKH